MFIIFFYLYNNKNIISIKFSTNDKTENVKPVFCKFPVSLGTIYV